MLQSASSISSKHSSLPEIESALDSCNAVFERDFGPGHILNAGNMPDIVLMAKTHHGNVFGVVGLHFHEETRAWEIGTVSAMVRGTHNNVLRFLLNTEASVAIRRWYGEGDAWLVHRMKQRNLRLQASMKEIGFELPEHFLIGVMSDDGYVPFDPVDEVLMKKKVVFAVDP